MSTTKAPVPNAGISRWGKSWPVGTVKVFEGRTQIMLAKGGWVTYPSQASDIVTLGREHGWNVDDGITVNHSGLTVRLYSSGDPYVRVSLARAPGAVAGRSAGIDWPDESPGREFHLVWTMNDRTRRWRLYSLYCRDGFQGQWTELKSITYVRHVIVSEPLRLPSPYISESR